MKRTFITLIAAILAIGVCNAETQDKTVGGTSGYPAKGFGGAVLFERTIDFSLSANTGTSNDTFQLLNIPAGTFIVGVGYEIEANAAGTYTGEDGTLTVDIGDDDDTDGWFDGANVATGQTACAWSTWAFGGVAAVVTNVADTTGTFATNVSVTMADLVYDSDGNGTLATQTVVTAVSALTDDAVTGTTATTLNLYAATSAPVGYAEGKLYTSADTLDMKLNNAADQLKITIRAIGFPVKGR